MNIIVRIIIDLLLASACFFAFSGTIGMLRMRDVYCRMQASTIISVFWFLGLMLAGLIYGLTVPSGPMCVKVILISLFCLLTAAVGGHAIARAAYIHGDRPYRRLKPDQYGEDKPYEKEVV